MIVVICYPCYCYYYPRCYPSYLLSLFLFHSPLVTCCYLLSLLLLLTIPVVTLVICKPFCYHIISILRSRNTCYPCFYFLVLLLLVVILVDICVICYFCYLVPFLFVTLVTCCPYLLFLIPSVVTCYYPYCYFFPFLFVNLVIPYLC